MGLCCQKPLRFAEGVIRVAVICGVDRLGWVRGPGPTLAVCLREVVVDRGGSLLQDTASPLPRTHPSRALPTLPSCSTALTPSRGRFLGARKNSGGWDPLPLHALLPSPTCPQLLHSLAPLAKHRSQNAIKAAFSEPLVLKGSFWEG